MARRSRPGSRRAPSLTSSPSSSSLHSDTTQLFHNNRFSPDLPQLAADLSTALLHLSADDPLCDVVLRSADDVDIPANKSVLAVRSPYFRNLFFSRFAEAAADRVTLPLRAAPLHRALHYIYTADAPLVHDAVRRLPPRTHPVRPQQHGPRPPPRALLHDLIDLAVAADYIHVTPLQRLANDALTALVSAFPAATCTALEAIRAHPTALKFCDLYRVWSDVVRRPRHFFLVPDCLAVPALHPENPLLPHFGALELSAETLDHCLTRVAPPVDYEYLFQVVYFWATGGEILKRCPPPDVALDTVKVATKRRGAAGGARGLGKGAQSRASAASVAKGTSGSVLSSLTTSTISSAATAPTSTIATAVNSAATGDDSAGLAPASAPRATSLVAGIPPPAHALVSSTFQPQSAAPGQSPARSSSTTSTTTLIPQPAGAMTSSMLPLTATTSMSAASAAAASVTARRGPGTAIPGRTQQPQPQPQPQTQAKTAAPASPVPERVRDAVRWQRAADVTHRIDFKQVRPLFLRDYVEWTGLVPPARLVAAYRFHATRGASPLAPRTRELMRTAAKRSREQAANGN